MKKVLALVLAVIMVCTMAMALTVGGDPYSETADEGTYINVNPGTVIAIEAQDFEDWGLELFNDIYAPEVENADGKVIGKNKLTLTFGKGADLVASQGWVEVDDGVYEYQIALKENDSKELDETIDLTISKVTLRATGNTKDQVVVLDGKVDANGDLVDGHGDKVQFDVGYEVVELAMDENSELDITPEITADLFKNHMRGIIVKVTKGESKATTGNLVIEDDIDLIAVVPIKVGQKFFVSNPFIFESKTEKAFENITISNVFGETINPTSLTLESKVGQYTLIDWDEEDNLYAYNYRTGKFTKLNEKFEDGVLTFNVPTFSWIFSVEGTIAGAATETGTETTTNPGTGANDVVGVASALAVVALVSGAAISLKK